MLVPLSPRETFRIEETGFESSQLPVDDLDLGEDLLDLLELVR